MYYESIDGHLYADFCVVGAGLIGSAAAKYLQILHPHAKVILVGSPEPENRQHTDVFGSHYDEGRIVREVDKDPTWGVLNRESLNSFSEICQQSGFEFFTQCGFCVLAPSEKGSLVHKYMEATVKTGVPRTILKEQDVKKRFPFLKLPPGTIGVFGERAGHINPRILIKAEIAIAKSHCCEIIHDIVDSIEMEPSKKHTVKLASGKIIHAEKVLLATGAFTESRNLLPKDFLPDMSITTETVLFVEVSDATLRTLRNMPSMASTVKLSSGMVGYILPPIRYPDGKYYMKIGHFRDYNLKLHKDEIPSWYRGDHNPHREKSKLHLLNVFTQIFPDVPVVNYHFDYGCTSLTSTNYPFIDMLNATLGVALGGCGVSAKCSDEIGKIAARMLAKGSWDYNLLSKESFKFQNRLNSKL